MAKMHKPIFVSFIDLMFFISAAFFTFTQLWAHQEDPNMNQAKATFKVISYNLVLLLKFIYDVVYIKFLSKKDMNSSQSTSGLFWSRIFFSIVMFEFSFLLTTLIFNHKSFTSNKLKNKRGGLVAPLLLLFFIIDFFIYHFCVTPAYYRMCYQKHVDKKFDPELKKKIEKNYQRK
jgi:hypothetical protein